MGLWEIIKTAEHRADGQKDKKKPSRIFIWIIIIAVFILGFGGFSDREEKSVVKKEETASSIDTFVQQQEEGLEKILKKINGAGDVSVFITIEGGGEKVPARDNKNRYTRESEENPDLITDEESESQVVMSGKSSSGEPYIIKEKMPEVTGVLIVAEGAADERVRIEIYEAVKALYGMSSHRIKVTY